MLDSNLRHWVFAPTITNYNCSLYQYLINMVLKKRSLKLKINTYGQSETHECITNSLQGEIGSRTKGSKYFISENHGPVLSFGWNNSRFYALFFSPMKGSHNRRGVKILLKLEIQLIAGRVFWQSLYHKTSLSITYKHEWQTLETKRNLHKHWHALPTLQTTRSSGHLN